MSIFGLLARNGIEKEIFKKDWERKFFFIYMWLQFYRHAQTSHIVIRIMHYSPTLRHILDWSRFINGNRINRISDRERHTLELLTKEFTGGSLAINTTPTHLRCTNNTATHFTDLGRMEGCFNLAATRGILSILKAIWNITVAFTALTSSSCSLFFTTFR